MTFHTTTSTVRLAAVGACCTALASVLIPALALVVTASITNPALLAQVAMRSWLIAMGATIQVAGDQLTLIPLGGTVLTVAIYCLVVRRILSGVVDQPATFIVASGGTFAVLAAMGALATNTAELGIPFVRAAIVAGILGSLGAGFGLMSRQGFVSDVSPRIQRIYRGAAGTVGALIAIAAVLVVILFMVHLPRAADLWAALNPSGSGVWGLGVIGLAAICFAFVPNAVIWTVSVLIGPGFAIGADTSVDLTGAHISAVPGLPLLAGLPSPGEFSGWVFLLALIPALAGIVAGIRIYRDDLTIALIDSALAGCVAGLCIAVLAAISAGALGPGRMNEIGPSVISTAITAVLTLSLAAMIGATLSHYLGAHYRRVGEIAADRSARFRIRKHPRGAASGSRQ